MPEAAQQFDNNYKNQNKFNERDQLEARLNELNNNLNSNSNISSQQRANWTIERNQLIEKLNNLNINDKSEFEPAQPVKQELEVKTKPAKFLIVENVFSQKVSNDHSRYPFDELEVGQGLFVSNDDYAFNHRTVVQFQPSNVPRNELLDFMRKEIYRARDYYGIVEHDIDGNEVWEDVNVRVRENKLDSLGNPVIGSNIVHRPRMIYSRFFSAYEVKKDAAIGENTKAPADGVLVIREA